MTSILQVKNLSKLYGSNRASAQRMLRAGLDKEEIYEKTRVTVALNNINLDLRAGEILVIIGLSGSGKSTLLRMFNRLNSPSSGQVLYRGQDLASLNKGQLRDYRKNNISMVFQNFGLLDHKTVLENISYGLDIKGLDRQKARAKSLAMMEMVGLDGLEDQSISSLSGGMKQRVGIARALATDPEILLMDEPFSALDPLVRQDMQFELISIQENLSTSIVFITHDINEAFKLGDRVAILKDGQLIQLDSPANISKEPANDYVKDFIGHADKSKVMTIRDIMIRPSSVVRISDAPSQALNIMRENAVSSAYVLGPRLKFLGVISLDDALRATREKLSIEEVLISNVVQVHQDDIVYDIMDLAIESSFPLAVVDDSNNLKGIVSKVHILTSIK